MPPPYLILAGPTAVGKTELSLRLAERLGAEIISADSRQVYRQLTIGTAKPDAEALARVRHHFVDELDLAEPFSAGIFLREATRRIADILERGRVPLVVGGSTLYLHALQHGLSEMPEVAPEVRAGIEARLAVEGAERLFEELRRADPAVAATMDPTKTQRLVRALEVLHATGQPLSSYHAERAEPPVPFRTVVLYRERAELYERINRRVDVMLASGLLAEVAGLLDAGYEPGLYPLRTIGYQEPIDFLQGRIDRPEMIRLIKRNTRRYAKRQLTWFRRDVAATWVAAEDALSFFDLQ